MIDFDKCAFPVLSQKRISELEEMLPEAPRGMGQPASNRAVWDKFAQQKGAADIIKAAEELLDQPFPKLDDELYLLFLKTGNRTKYEAVNYKRLTIIYKLLIAECLEYKGRFLAKLEECLADLLSQRSWVLPAHDRQLLNFNDISPYPDLASSSVTAFVAYIDWLLQDKLQAATRERIRREAMHRTIEAYLDTIRKKHRIDEYNYWTICESNWNAVCTCNMVSACLILLESRRERAEVLAAMEQSNRLFFTGFKDDGYCSEGKGYWSYGFGHFLCMAEFVLDATGGKLNILDGNPLVRKCCEYPRNVTITRDIAPAFADCGFTRSFDTLPLAIIQKHFPELLLKPVPTFSQCDLNKISYWREFVIFAFMGEPNRFPKKDAMPTPYSYFRESGVLICRASSGMDGCTFGAAIKGGHNEELHNHNDVGSYVIVLNGTAPVADYGGEVYTKRTFSDRRYESKMLNSYGHDVPVVAGKLQMTGRQAQGIISEETFNDEVSSILIDMTSCYDVKELLSLKRRFTFDYAKRTVTIIDEVEFSSPQSFEDAILTNAKYCIEPKNTLRFWDEKAALAAEIAVSGADWRISTKVIDNPERISPTRLAITLDRPVMKASVTIIFREAH